MRRIHSDCNGFHSVGLDRDVDSDGFRDVAKFPSVDKQDEVGGERVRPSLVAVQVSGESSSLRGGRTDDR